MKKIIFLLCLSLSTFAFSSFTKGVISYNKADYKSAFLAWLPLAEAKNGAAQYNVAKLYQHGRGVRKDSKEALKWFEKALKNGVNLADIEIKTLQPTLITTLKNKKTIVKKVTKEKSKKLVRIEREIKDKRLARIKKIKELEKIRVERLVKIRTRIKAERLAKIEVEKKKIKKLAQIRDEIRVKKYNTLTSPNSSTLAPTNVQIWALKNLREKGVIEQFHLTKPCLSSASVKKDCQVVFDRYEQPANKNYSYAQYILGLIYAQGMSNTSNINAAKFWLNKAKNQRTY